MFNNGNICYTIPKMNRDLLPCPSYHSIEDGIICLVHWELFYKNMNLRCKFVHPNGEKCVGILYRERLNFGKNNKLFPIFSTSGTITWAIVTRYRCDICGNGYNGNCADVLSQLPDHIRDLYPVEMKYTRPMTVVDKNGKRSLRFDDGYHICRKTTNVIEEKKCPLTRHS